MKWYKYVRLQGVLYLENHMVAGIDRRSEQDWETLLGAPLEDVRRRLAVPPPAAYLTLRSAIAR